MMFPVTSREVYAQNFIKEAVCQVRFSRLLEIDSQLPMHFQRALIDSFPLLETRQQFGIVVGFGTESSPPVPSSTTIYDFKTSTGDTMIALSSDYVSVASTAYKSWAELRGHLTKAVTTLRDCYSVGPFLRLGLRYINVLPKDGDDWGELLHESLVGPLATEQRAHVDDWKCSTSFSMGDDCQLNLNAGLQKGEAETSMVLDFDIFSTTSAVLTADEVAARFDDLNAMATDAFVWAQGPALKERLSKVARTNDAA